ncbi:MAG: hypothetical protein LBJ92_01435 [Holosporales bacterium]|jgi:hypothetical protein|nr:hypothetical protein [Holosporales bacterium]
MAIWYTIQQKGRYQQFFHDFIPRIANRHSEALWIFFFPHLRQISAGANSVDDQDGEAEVPSAVSWADIDPDLLFTMEF